MEQKRKTNTYRLTATADCWITEQAKANGISKNDVIQMLVNKAMGGTQLVKPTVTNHTMKVE